MNIFVVVIEFAAVEFIEIDKFVPSKVQTIRYHVFTLGDPKLFETASAFAEPSGDVLHTNLSRVNS